MNDDWADDFNSAYNELGGLGERVLGIDMCFTFYAFDVCITFSLALKV